MIVCNNDFNLADGFRPGQLSESEFEADGVNEVELPQDLSTRGCKQSSMCAVRYLAYPILYGCEICIAILTIRLIELGPRLNLTLIKIQEGISDGEVLFHQYIKKTPAEIQQIREIREKKR